ncbi:hypothetical protein, partial [Escherichia coli]|uniref:hypothetical protein n=2 Tax=Enterobacteriaceae TaxID=543 RepID=UPI0013D3651E
LLEGGAVERKEIGHAGLVRSVKHIADGRLGMDRERVAGRQTGYFHRRKRPEERLQRLPEAGVVGAGGGEGGFELIRDASKA